MTKDRKKKTTTKINQKEDEQIKVIGQSLVKQGKTRMTFYVRDDMADNIKRIGKEIGKPSGGNSALAEAAFEEYFKNHNLIN